ncbi:MAG: efflux RND transporter permease subunit [Desulfobacterales bacterium]|nr:efflux RND transporter permease subunit [Desulfobacterales bacterium]
MKSVVKFSIKQTVLLNVVFVILVVAGAFSIFTTPLENMPVVDMGNVFINTIYYGASAEDVEQLVTVEIEKALDGLEDVEWIKSDSYRNFSSVEVKFLDDSDYRFRYDELRFRVLNIKDELPPDADESTFMYLDTNIWLPVVIVNITGDMPQRSLEQYAEELRTSLLSLPDVRDAEIEGEYDTEFHVSLDPAKLRRFGITFQQVVDAIRSANTKIPTGRFRARESEYMLDAGDRLNSQEEVLNTVVRRDGDGNFVRVRNLVTNARLSHRDPSVIPSVNGQSTVRMPVTKEIKGNAIEISAAVKKAAREFEDRHRRDGIQVIFTNDSTIEINDSLNTLGGNLLLGMGLVTLVLWVTLGFRNAMLTAIGIPFAFLCSVLMMQITGVSLNTISLFAFVLVTGIMVDDAVIIVENIYRHFQMGKSKKEAVVDGTSEVMLPVIASALTTILAFIPMLMMTGSTGDFFSYIPKTVTYALIASLLEALLILPIHFLEWGPREGSRAAKKAMHHDSENPFAHLEGGLFAPFWKAYNWSVVKILNHKIITFTVMTVILVSSVGILVLSASGILPLIKVEFFPGNYFRYRVTVTAPVGTAIEQTDAIVRDVSRYIMSLGTGQAHSTAGSAGFYEDQDYARHDGSHFGQIVVTLPEEKLRDFPENPSNDPQLHLDVIRRKLAEFVERQYPPEGVVPVVRVFKESDGPPTGKAVNIRVTGISLKDAVAAGDRLKAFMQTDEELADLVDLNDNRPDFHKTFKFVPRQEAVFEYGLQPAAVTQMVAGALNGQYVGKFRTIDEEVDLLVRIARRADRGNINGTGLAEPLDILGIPVVEDSASPVLLRDLIDVKPVFEPDVKSRYKGKPTITLTADIKPGSRLSPARVQVLVNKFISSRPNDFTAITVAFGGEFESTSKSYASLTMAFFIALLAIYMVLSSQFKDYVQPMIIISSVPMALIGVVFGLLITRTTFTIGSFLAIIGLAGLAVNDSLLLIDFMNVRLRQGKPLRQAIIESCAARMRPVLITTITTTLGLLPMAIGIPNKSISWAPMATAFVSGLISATVLTLLITPANYEAFEQLKAFVKRIFRRRALRSLLTRRRMERRTINR